MSHPSWQTAEWETLVAMERYGGSFVQQLAKLYRCADSENAAKLMDAFPEYFSEYYALAQRASTPEPAA